MIVSKFILIIILIVGTNQFAFGQKINYLKMRDSMKSVSCDSVDSSDVYGSIRRLETVDTNRIGKNIHIYYEDLALCYGLVSKERNDHYRLKSIAANQAALYHKPNSTRALWNIAFDYVHNGDCSKGRYYMDLCKKYTPEKYWNATSIEQEERLLAKCD